jgi:HK97 family phage major capsid protein
LCYATDGLLADQATLESVLMDGFAEEFGFLVDDAVIRGTGVGMPLGILNSNAVVTVPKENAQAARSLTAENIINMWARL